MTRKKAGAGGFFCLHENSDGTTSPEKSILKIAKFCYALLTNPSQRVPDVSQYTFTRNQNANSEVFQRPPAAWHQIASGYKKYFEKFGLMGKTGVDLPGEAATIMHKKENVGQVELATMSFGQSFQVTPMQMATTVCSLVNGGKRITPHFGVAVYDAESGEKEETISYGKRKRILSKETSEKMRKILETVVSEGGGKKAQIEGYRIGGKTATSQTLPRSANRYIGSFIGFAPADDPQVAAMAIIYNPQGIYYGGTIAAPVVRDIFDNILPYLGIEREENP